MADLRSSSTIAPSVRLRLHLGPKVGVLLGLALGICIPYFGLQRIDGLPLRSVPIMALDRIIPFEPAWTWAYVSLGLLVPLAPLLSSRRDELARFARGLAMLCVPCFLVFLLFPVEGPRPGAVPDAALYRWIVCIDRPSNSMPSLHAGLTLYSLLHLARVLPTTRPRWISAAGWGWGALILYSTLATRQHWVVDLPAGMGIAWIAHAIAWRTASSERTEEGVPLTARS